MAFIFEVLRVSYHHNRGQFIFARLLDGGLDFEIEDGALFGGIPIYNYVEMPRILDENNEPRLDIFVFRPLQPMQKADLVEGQKVELLLPDK